MPSDFRIQVVNRQSGDIVHSWEPGLRVEREFVQSLVDALASKPIGVFRTKATVLVQVKQAIETFLYDLKRQV